MRAKKHVLIISLLLIIPIIFSGCKDSSSTSTVNAPVHTGDSTTTASYEETAAEEPTTAYVEPVTITLSAIGDMLMHAGASNPAVQADGSYNYSYLFANVLPAIQSADIAVVNEEVIFGGNELGNIGYPQFNVRTELGDAIAAAGFDVVLHANNHTMDQHASGILNTINFWETNYPDMTYLGIHSSEEAASEISVMNVKGINVAILNYTYGLNGFSTPEGMDYIVDLMNDTTKNKIADDISRAKELADFVIVCPHWGTEYTFDPSDEQKEWTAFFAEQEVDLVIGSHPHVVEPVEWVESSSGHKMLVYYSLGNFVSVQYYNFSMLGGMAQVSITKDSSGTYISDYDMDFLVTHYTAGRTAITTYFLDDYTDALASTHAILVEPGEKYMNVNSSYPFTIAGLKALAEKICPDLVDY